MRLVLALCIVTASGMCANALDWQQMNGHQRRQYLVAYTASNNLSCRLPEGAPSTIKEQEAALMQYTHWQVQFGIKLFCSPRGEELMAKRQRPHPTPLVKKVRMEIIPAKAKESLAKAPERTPNEEVRFRWPEKSWMVPNQPAGI